MNASKPQTLLRALLVSYLLSGVLLILLSLALYRLKLPEEQINLAVYGVYAAACFFGGFLSGRSIKSRRFFWGLITGLLYFAVLTAVSFLTAHGGGDGWGDDELKGHVKMKNVCRQTHGTRKTRRGTFPLPGLSAAFVSYECFSILDPLIRSSLLGFLSGFLLRLLLALLLPLLLRVHLLLRVDVQADLVDAVLLHMFHGQVQVLVADLLALLRQMV